VGTYKIQMTVRDPYSSGLCVFKIKVWPFFTYLLYDEPQDEVINANDSTQVVRLVYVSETGFADITFEEPLFTVHDFSWFYPKKVLELRVVRSGELMEPEMITSWDVVSFTPKQMRLKVNFRNFYELSFMQELDQLQVLFKLNGMFMSSVQRRPLNLNTKVRQKIPSQVSSGAAA